MAHSNLIHRPLPQAVTYNISHSSYTEITLHPGSKWTSGLHWHESHEEYLRVEQGSIWVRLGDKVQVLAKGDEATVHRGERHEWRRADKGEDPHGSPVIVREWTDPDDGQKRVFFRTLNEIILRTGAEQRENSSKMASWIPTENLIAMRLFALFWKLDNFPVLFDLESSGPAGVSISLRRSVEFLVTYSALIGATFALRLMRIPVSVSSKAD